MRVRLLTVSGLSLEISREGLTVHEPIACNDADGSALGKDVQKRGLLFERDQFSSIELTDKGGRTFPAPDSPINAVNFPGTT